MSTQGRKGRNKRLAMAALVLIGSSAVGSTIHLHLQREELEAEMTTERNNAERARSGQQLMQVKLLEATALLERTRQQGAVAQETITAMEQRLNETLARAESLERAADHSSRRNAELAELREAAQQLRDELDRARANEIELRTTADRAIADRDVLAARLEQREAAALMVDNAGLDATKGRKGRLTVVARRTREVRMAFDLPEALAREANYRIIAPDGSVFDGGEPVVSTGGIPADATASTSGMASPVAKHPTSHVDLRFRTTERLKPGAYRVEVLSGSDHLQTLQLNLR
ncbi:MAG: hypothetical protein H6590_08390 [Flavobacteriales bacterium]|nr:hypothetical protein [Flavobacteriales bacterium]HPF89572.1 hypothetical protein [Flavobacteriales bacterium]